MKNRIIISLFIAASLVFVGCGKTEGISKIGTEVSESSENAIREEFDTEVEFAEGTEEIGSTESTEVAEISNSGTSSNNSQGNAGTLGGSSSNNTTGGSATSNSTTSDTHTNAGATTETCIHSEWFPLYRDNYYSKTVTLQEEYTETVSYEHTYFTCDTCGQRFETQNDIDAHFNEEAQKALEQSVATGQYVADHSGQTAHTETLTKDVYHAPVTETKMVCDVEPTGSYQCAKCGIQDSTVKDYYGGAASVVTPPQWYKDIYPNKTDW